ncbi:MAG: GntR family transcriptional regulator [Chloroflexi bacterium]|nr:GntR family transcriptional regulator [Chloroflexota bacterium]
MPQLHRRGPIPLYAQVKQLLRLRITADEKLSDGPLPSERELARELGVSRMTIRQALRELSDEGAVFTAPGRGTFRASPKPPRPLGVLTGFTQDMLQRGLTPSSRVLAMEQIADPHIAERLDLAPDVPLARIQRLRLADGEPMALEVTHLPFDLCPGLLSIDLEQRSLYEVLQSVFQLRLKGAEQSIESRGAEPGTAALLRVEPGAAVLYLERTTQMEDGRFVEFARSWYRGDRYHFRISLST